MKRKERILAELQEDSEEDRKNKLDMLKSELESVNTRINGDVARFKGRKFYYLLILITDIVPVTVKVPVKVSMSDEQNMVQDLILNFHGHCDCNGHGIGMCKQTLKATTENQQWRR